MLVTVIGATGFVGSHLVPHLVARGHTVRAVSRAGLRRPDWREGVESMAGDVETGAGLDAALQGADGVVHLVAIPRERRGRSFEAVNVRGVEHALAAAKHNGVARFVHVSVLSVTDERRLRYLSSRGRGERLVRESELDWVVLRPSVMFGAGDGFFNLVKTTLTWWSPGVIAIPGDGSWCFQPLSADDLAIAIEACLTDASRTRNVYELGGPEHVTYRQIVDRVMLATGKRRLKLSVPVPLIGALTAVTDRVLPFFPVTHDQIGSMTKEDCTDLDAYERAFGVRPRPMDLSYLA